MTSKLQNSGAAALALALTAGVMSLLAAPPANAAPLGESVSRAVSTHDLDLASADGQERLDARIRSAARKVCAAAPASRIDAAGIACRKAALVAATGEATLLAEHAGAARLAMASNASTAIRAQ